jgi:hypothetical protein
MQVFSVDIIREVDGMSRLTLYDHLGLPKVRYPYLTEFEFMLKELQHYKDLEEQGRLIDWKRTSEEKPNSTRHLIAAYGEIISHYAYYLKPKDKWFTDWTCEKELDAPIFWADMPDPPEESLHNDCVAKLAELKGE